MTDDARIISKAIFDAVVGWHTWLDAILVHKPSIVITDCTTIILTISF